MTFAVHSIHVRSAPLLDGGISHAPGIVIKLPEPIYTADTMEGAERWRLERLRQWKEGK